MASGYLDLIYRAKHEFRVPVAAYNVSGEYSMLRAAGLNGWLEEKRAVMEVLTSIKRAGADMILSYFATEVAKRLNDRGRESGARHPTYGWLTILRPANKT